MLSRFELLNFIILLQHFSLGQRLAPETYTAVFKTSVTGSSGTTECDFTLRFTDVEVLKKNSKVQCSRNKPMIINSFKYEIESSMLHIFKESLYRFITSKRKIQKSIILLLSSTDSFMLLKSSATHYHYQIFSFLNTI